MRGTGPEGHYAVNR